MQEQNNKTLIHRLYDAINHGNIELVDALFSPSFVDHSTPDQVPGTQGVKDYFAQTHIGFPDMHITIENLIAENDTVVVRTTWRGTHRGVYEGVAPTGKQAMRTLIQIFRVVNNKIVEEWNEGRGLLEAVIA